MEWSDQNIPICCGICYPSLYREGLDKMIVHILEVHKDYTPEQAIKYARIWLHDAYEQAGLYT